MQVPHFYETAPSMHHFASTCLRLDETGHLGIRPDADHGAWSGDRGNPHAYPPFRALCAENVAGPLAAHNWMI